MKIDPVILAGIVAAVASGIILVISIKQSADLPEYRTREEQLSREVTELRNEIARLVSSYTEQIAKLKQDIDSLARMLLEKEKSNNELQARVRELEKNLDSGTKQKPKQERKPGLVLAVGTDKMLQVDVAKLRGIRKLQLSVIQDATKSDIASILEERRSAGRPVKLMHLAAHSGPEGILFSDGLADGIWLSSNLKDIEVLVIAGCKGHRVASLLTIIPFVVSMREEIDNADASTFSYHFWFAIGEGQVAEDAFFYALERSSSVVSEMAEFHSFV